MDESLRWLLFGAHIGLKLCVSFLRRSIRVYGKQRCVDEYGDRWAADGNNRRSSSATVLQAVDKRSWWVKWGNGETTKRIIEFAAAPTITLRC